MSQFTKIILLLSTLCCFLQTTSAYSVTQHKKSRFKYVDDPKHFRSSLSLEMIERNVELAIPKGKIYKRLKYAKQDPRIEAIQLNLFKDDERLKDLAIDLSKPGKSDQLFRYFKKVMVSNSVDEKDTYTRASLDLKALKSLDISKLADIHKRDHKNVKVQTTDLYFNKVKRRQFMDQLKPFLERKDMSRISKKIKNRLPLSLHKDLLSGFSRKMTGQYTIFRGPNCFHAALAFHTREMSESPFLNVKVEKGYHRAMINYDELWKAINHHFHEINPRKTALKYGDLLVFMDVPDDSREPYFKWIRHAATYLMGPYTFSKGSKSPNTPYSVKTLQEEWRTWRGYTDNLRVKVFRRNKNHVNKRPPKDLTEWIY